MVRSAVSRQNMFGVLPRRMVVLLLLLPLLCALAGVPSGSVAAGGVSWRFQNGVYTIIEPLPGSCSPVREGVSMMAATSVRPTWPCCLEIGVRGSHEASARIDDPDGAAAFLGPKHCAGRALWKRLGVYSRRQTRSPNRRGSRIFPQCVRDISRKTRDITVPIMVPPNPAICRLAAMRIRGKKALFLSSQEGFKAKRGKSQFF